MEGNMHKTPPPFCSSRQAARELGVTTGKLLGAVRSHRVRQPRRADHRARLLWTDADIDNARRALGQGG
jgi:hypothetical protein